MTLALMLGASLLAIWLDARFTFLRPKTATFGLVHAAVGTLSVFGAVGLLLLVYGDISDAGFMAVVLGVFLPALTYSLLAGLWMVRTLADITAARR